ncbi:MAG: hypothetical protein E7223_01100 [Clostridiales bacterium]|nr:hypothetical protein [Clostridiales bacterium]
MEYGKYERFQIALEGADPAAPGCGQGFLRVETGNGKGALRCVVSSLDRERAFREAGPWPAREYHLLFFGQGPRGPLAADLGRILVDRRGSGQLYTRFSPLNVAGSGCGLRQFSAAAVAAVPEEGGQPRALLQGALPAAQSAETRAQGGPPADQEGPAGEPVGPNGPAPLAPAGGAAPALPGRGGLQPPRKDYTGFYPQTLLRFCRLLDHAAGQYEPIQPFRKDSTRSRWLRLREPELLPVASPGARYFAAKGGHFLFGRSGETPCRWYYFAVPGSREAKDCPDGGRSGFALWQPSVLPEAEGYWIAAVNGSDGHITDPDL